jgi:hypothetical protein
MACQFDDKAPSIGTGVWNGHKDVLQQLLLLLRPDLRHIHGYPTLLKLFQESCLQNEGGLGEKTLIYLCDTYLFLSVFVYLNSRCSKRDYSKVVDWAASVREGDHFH